MVISQIDDARFECIYLKFSYIQKRLDFWSNFRETEKTCSKVKLEKFNIDKIIE